MEAARRGRRSRSRSEMSSQAEEPRLVEAVSQVKNSEGIMVHSRTKQRNGGEMAELVQRQPEVVLVFPKKSWPTAGLTNLLRQLATKLKQRHRTAGSGSAAYNKNKRKTENSVFGDEEKMKSCAEMCHRQQNQQLEAGTTAARVASSPLRPRRLAWLLMASVLLFSVLIAPVSMVQGNEIRPSQGKREYKKGGECKKKRSQRMWSLEMTSFRPVL